MDTKEVIKEKRALEGEIARLLREFTQKSGVQIAAIDIKPLWTVGLEDTGYIVTVDARIV